MISTWKGFYHNHRWRKESNPFPQIPNPLKSGNALIVSSGTYATFASEQGTAECRSFKSEV